MKGLPHKITTSIIAMHDHNLHAVCLGMCISLSSLVLKILIESNSAKIDPFFFTIVCE